jgi:hypothetical protein
MGADLPSGCGQQGPQGVGLEVAFVKGIVERGPLALHDQAQFGWAVWAGDLRHGIDDFEQGRRAAGEPLIQLLAELRQAFECFHPRKVGRSSVLLQAPLL